MKLFPDSDQFPFFQVVAALSVFIFSYLEVPHKPFIVYRLYVVLPFPFSLPFVNIIV